MSRVPSAPLTTRSSARSISSNPSRNGLDNEGTRDIFLQSPLEATLKFQGPCGAPGNRLADCPPVNSQYGHDSTGVQAPRGTGLEPSNAIPGRVEDANPESRDFRVQRFAL